MDATEGAQTDIYKKSRFLYIIEATLEYFVSILVGGAYLARLTNAVGISDATTGVLSAFVSLGCSAQMLAIFLSRAKRVKPFVTAGHFISQALFALLYFTPFVPVSSSFRAVLLGALLLLALLLTVFTLVYLQTVVKRLPRSRCGDTPRALPRSEGGTGE